MHCQFNFHAVKKKRINKNTKHVKQKLGFSIKFLFGLLVVCIEGTKRASYGDINGCNYGMAAPLFRERQFHPRALFFNAKRIKGNCKNAISLCNNLSSRLLPIKLR